MDFSFALWAPSLPLNAGRRRRRSQSLICCQAVKIGLLVQDHLVSPFRVEHPVEQSAPRAVPWVDVLRHTRTKLGYVDSGIEVAVAEFSQIEAEFAECDNFDALLLIGEPAEDLTKILAHRKQNTSVIHFATSGPEDVPRLGPLTVLGGVNPSSMAAKLPILGNAASQAARKDAILMEDLFKRNTSEDFLYMNMLFVNNYTALTIPGVASTLAADGNAGKRIWNCCSKELIACAKDPNCRKCMVCLAQCPANDQVSAYRCIVSHESKQLERTNLCIFEKNNCLENCAEIPMNPDPLPMTSWRGQKLSFDAAEEIFFGWLDKGLGWSWKVCAGQNPAYDHFSHQHQLWYRQGKNLWYDPVFQVTKLDGEVVWRRRHYRVRRAEQPGQFHFSVLDNGVISREYWRILAADAQLSWALFYYSGAATTAGFTYRGAILATADGAWPASPRAAEQIESALATAGIQSWELIFVNNDPLSAGSELAPLELPTGAETSSLSGAA